MQSPIDQEEVTLLNALLHVFTFIPVTAASELLPDVVHEKSVWASVVGGISWISSNGLGISCDCPQQVILSCTGLSVIQPL